MVMWSDYEPINGFMKDWYVHKEMLKKGDITEEGYFEWKVIGLSLDIQTHSYIKINESR